MKPPLSLPLVAAAGLAGLIGLAPAAAAAAEVDISKLPPAAQRPIDFDQDIQPLLEKHCIKCHGPEKQKSGWRADAREAALNGGDNYAPNIRPGKSAESPLIHFVAGIDKDMTMPQKGDRLTPEQVGLFRAWIDQGAKWSDGAVAAKEDPRKTHWAFQPVHRPENIPAGQNAIDALTAAKLAEKGLARSPEADRRTLIRRLSFDLIGLPPTPEEIDAFIADPDPQAYDKLVDRLLASPRYGERWARHWLDVVRFAESSGFEMNRAREHAWPYRDYVIKAFNDDKPYDQFVREQLAGDALGVDEGTGFLVGGPYDMVKSPDPVLTAQQRADELHDIVSTTGSAFLGLTVGCARCHNHKFDPISQVDYYAMTAALQGVRHGERILPPPDAKERTERSDQFRRELKPIETQLAAYQPLALPLRVITLDDSAAPVAEGTRPGITQIEHPKNGQPITYSPGQERGQAEDPGDSTRLPNLGAGYRYWQAKPGEPVDFFAWNPRLTGHFRVWVSWGAWTTHTKDARYILDRDGNPGTKDDQIEIANVDQSAFADGTPAIPQERRWSGLRNAGIHDLTADSCILLRAGEKGGPTVADAVVFEEVPADAAEKATNPHLRAPVTHRANEELFEPVEAKFVRFTITQSENAEGCIDELEVFTAGPGSRNVALAKNGGIATSSGVFADGANPLHQLAHLNDGRFGNKYSWIAKQRTNAWAQIEFAQPEKINRAVWSRDRSQEKKIYEDRFITGYRIEVSLDGQTWREVASSADRLGAEYRRRIAAIPTLNRVPSEKAAEVQQLVERRAKLQEQIKTLTAFPLAYIGKFEQPGPTFRLHRGDPMQAKEEVAPGGIVEFGGTLALEAGATEQQRRLALADWIVSPKNPLTARVLVNRIWHYHFGTGLVETPSDFGLNGARPTHPELLDWLASEFMTHGWHIKELQRLIVTSATYRQASSVTGPNAEHGMKLDASSRFLWRFPPRRLEAEPLRDTILAVSGQLDLRMGGPGFDLFEPNDNYVKIYTSKKTFGPGDFRRMVYQNKPRVQLDDVFGAFDCPDAGQIAPRRTNSTTPLQALNLMNSAFALQQAGYLAERLKREAGDQPAPEIRRAFRLLFGRDPSPEETTEATALITEHGLLVFCRALFNANEFISVN